MDVSAKCKDVDAILFDFSPFSLFLPSRSFSSGRACVAPVADLAGSNLGSLDRF